MAVAAAQRRQARRLASELRDAVVRHHLLTFASAVSFRALVALVTLTLLGLGVLGALGQASVWENSIAPTIRRHVTGPVFGGIDFSVRRVPATALGEHGLDRDRRGVDRALARLPRLGERRLELQDRDRLSDRLPRARRLHLPLGARVHHRGAAGRAPSQAGRRIVTRLSSPPEAKEGAGCRSRS